MQKFSRTHFGVAALLLASMMAAGCGGGGGGGTPASPANPAPGNGDNAAPTIQGQPTSTVLVGQSYSFQPSASDANNDPLTFTASNVPAWASFDSSTGRLSGTPGSADVGTYAGITITVSDGKSTAALGPFTVTVTASASGAATLSWMPPTQNSDGSALTNLAGFEVLYGRTAGDMSQSVSLDNPSISTYVLENLTPGTWYFAVMAVNAVGVTSPLSNVATKTIG